MKNKIIAIAMLFFSVLAFAPKTEAQITVRRTVTLADSSLQTFVVLINNKSAVRHTTAILEKAALHASFYNGDTISIKITGGASGNPQYINFAKDSIVPRFFSAHALVSWINGIAQSYQQIGGWTPVWKHGLADSGIISSNACYIHAVQIDSQSVVAGAALNLFNNTTGAIAGQFKQIPLDKAQTITIDAWCPNGLYYSQRIANKSRLMILYR